MPEHESAGQSGGPEIARERPGWQQDTRRRHPPVGGETAAPRGRQAPQQQWVPTRNRFSVLQEEPTGDSLKSASSSRPQGEPQGEGGHSSSFPSVATVLPCPSRPHSPSLPIAPHPSPTPIPSPDLHRIPVSTSLVVAHTTPIVTPHPAGSPPPPGSARRSLQSSFLASRAAQEGSSSPRPLVVISTSPMAAIPPRLVSFDYHQRGESFGYEFTQYFGELDDSRPATRLRVHVAILASRGASAIDSAVAFSFPLCGHSQANWTLPAAMRFMRAQIIEFSHHLGE